jgi:hypothetical protein
MGTFIHEIGHTIFFWIFGYVALPAFDFEGGGFSKPFFGQIILIQIGIWLLFSYVIINKFTLSNPILYVLMTIVTSLFVIGFFKFHQFIYIFMGVGFEALVGGILIFRGLFGLTSKYSNNITLNAEAACHFIVGFALNARLIERFYSIIHDPMAKGFYLLKGKRGASNDFVVIADLLHINLDQVCYFAIGFGFACLLIPMIFFCIATICDTFDLGMTRYK